MYTLYSTLDQAYFEWEAEAETLPEIIQELGKWLSIRVMYLDGNIANDNKASDANGQLEYWYIFKGKKRSDELIGMVTIKVQRARKPKPL